MKKTTLITSLLLVLIAFTSCKKDGIYDPKERIDKIYYGYNTVKYLGEDWTWEKKQLKTIDYYNLDGTIDETYRFNYDRDNRLCQVACYENGEVLEYKYDKKLLNKAYLYDNGVIEAYYTFEYDDKKLSEIEVTLIDGTPLFSTNKISDPLANIIPQQTLKSINTILKETALRDDTTRFVIDVEWNDDNISVIEIERGKYAEKYLFEYDDKTNPLRDFLGLNIDEASMTQTYSKNNVTKITSIGTLVGISTTEEEIISYTYDGKFPVTKTVDEETLYFEYE